MFSFNSPFGACEHCGGLGFTKQIDEDLIINDKSKSIAGGALANIFATMEVQSFYRQMIEALVGMYETVAK